VTGVRAADGLPDPTGTPLVHGAVAVDEEVVADVAPVAGLRVVRVDAAHDAGCLAAGVVVAACRVVDEDGLEGPAVARRPALVAEALVGAPLAAGAHLTRCGRRRAV